MITVEDTPQLNISRLKGCYVSEGKRDSGTYRACDSDPLLYLESDLTGEHRILNIRYKKHNSPEWIEYQIMIEAVPLNFGKGVQLLFICPVSNRPSRILYYDFKTHLFVNRKAYSQRLYYPIQTFSGEKRVSENIRIHEENLIKCFLQLKNETYGGMQPKSYMRIRKLQKKKELLDLLQTKFMVTKFSEWEKKFN